MPRVPSSPKTPITRSAADSSAARRRHRVASAPFPLQFSTAAELLALCDEQGLTIAEAARRNEEALRPEETSPRARRHLGRHDGVRRRGLHATPEACSPASCV
jgi:hypothetical protein